MRWLDELDRRFGRFAIPNLTQLLIATQVAVLVMSWVQPQLLELLIMRPDKVLQGEVHRVLTFLVVPTARDPIFAFFFYYLFFFMGTALESSWGTFRYNIYLLVGYVATIAVSFVTPDVPAGNGFLQASVFLAFACLFPDFELRIFFVLPVKVKYLAWLAWFGYLVMLATGDWHVRLAVVASIGNFLLFFGPDFVHGWRAQRRQLAWRARSQAQRNQPRHTCTVCGVNSTTHPDVEFRYCTKCDGDCAYCPEHLRTHEHLAGEKRAAETD